MTKADSVMLRSDDIQIELQPLKHMCVRSLEDGNEEVDEQDVRHNEIDGHDGGNEPIAGGARAVLFTVVS